MNSWPQYVTELPEGHPVTVYFEENHLIQSLLSQLTGSDAEQDFELFFNLFNQLAEVEKRFSRKENQLFPYLEKHGWTGPSQGMWAFHDEIRDLFREVRACIEAKTLNKVSRIVKRIAGELFHLMEVEEHRLFPNALELLSEDDWKEMREGDVEIGWMLSQEPVAYPKETAEEEYVHPGEDRRKRRLPFSTDDRIRMNEGYMSAEQLNLMLQFMPVDLTYVDENDIVVFYNRGENRVFPRSAGIIGREVKFCHPPKSVDPVLQILEAFKKGTQDTAEFWINFKDKKIHIRYFALRDKEDNYKGVIEMSQDITEILKIEGQQRLLDWG
ncbi:DUF438 domain-containing protein [Colwellia sp. 12G3]|uniref:DUF438 domain-containing protein n=1 Tax=Colwellia sp. 12G3 TaxID=2058299 RepID=UPI000C32AEA7|nr:PAS domain-containing protein [Colwellia sp. 12G3]PKI14803.1 histidine kinase [Colwellia sp. 12G3]